MAKLYVLLPVHNRKDITRIFIECLKKQTFVDYHLVLIDDGSTDGTPEMVLKYISSVTVIQGSGNWWWAGSLQKGIDWLKQQNLDKNTLVLFINDDVFFFPDYFEKAISVMSQKKGTLVLSRYIELDTNKIIETGIHADWKHMRLSISDNQENINCLSTRGLFLYWEDICTIGGFHPILLPHYSSDYEYTIRAHKKGFRCETSPEILIVPNHETTGYRDIDSDELLTFFSKLFSKKHVSNPIYLFIFVLMASDMAWILPNFIRILLRTSRKILASLKSTIMKNH